MTAPASTPGNAVATVDTSEKKGIVAFFQARAPRIVPFLSNGVTIERVAAATYLAIKKDPTGKLAKCDPETIVLAAAKVCQWGLEIGETAHLVPFGATATAIADYKGLVELVLRSGAARAVTAHPVFEGEEFEVELGLNPILRHVPSGTGEKRGRVVGAYAIFRLSFGNVHIQWMPADEIDEIRRKYSKQWKEGPLPGWYAVKTVIRQGVKLLPKNPKLAAVLRAVEDDEAAEFGEPVLDVPAGLSGGEAPRALSAGEEEPVLADHWSRSRPLANQADGFGYGDADETPLAPEAIQAMRDEPDPFTGEQTTDGELPLGEPPVRAVRRSAQGEGR
jgi:recombination protein RecT